MDELQIESISHVFEAIALLSSSPSIKSRLTVLPPSFFCCKIGVLRREGDAGKVGTRCQYALK
jgi:hypothetical protein